MISIISIIIIIDIIDINVFTQTANISGKSLTRFC